MKTVARMSEWRGRSDAEDGMLPTRRLNPSGAAPGDEDTEQNELDWANGVNPTFRSQAVPDRASAGNRGPSAL